MPVVEGVDIPPPPGGAQGPDMPPRVRPRQRRPPRMAPPFAPPPVLPHRRQGGIFGGAGLSPAVIGGFLLVCIVAWIAIGVVRGAADVATNLGGAAYGAAEVASSRVTSGISGAASSVAEAASNWAGREERSPSVLRDARPAASAQREADLRSEVPVPEAASPPSVGPGSRSTQNSAASREPLPPSPGRASPRNPTQASNTTDTPRTSSLTAAPEQAQAAMAAAQDRLRSGDYLGAHARAREALRSLGEPGRSHASPTDSHELRIEVEELANRIVRSCRTERDVLRARGDRAPECPEGD